MIHMIQGKCRLCGRPAVAKFEDDAHPEAVDKFLPLLTHDACYDAIDKRNRAGERIAQLCFEYSRTGKAHRGEVIDGIRKALLVATRTYAEAITFLLDSQVMIWSEEFADLLLASPDQCGKILQQYRDEVRRQSRKAA